MMAHGCSRNVALLVCGLAVAGGSFAQSSAWDIPKSSKPYVPLYSACRAKAPDDPVARALFDALKLRNSNFENFAKLLDPLRAKPAGALSAVEAEAYFTMLGRMVFLMTPPAEAAERRGAVLFDARAHGAPIAKRFRDESFVRCAFLDSEARMSREALRSGRISEKERTRLIDEYIAFLEGALRGKVRTDTHRDELQSRLGQLYFDRGLDVLPDTAKAAPLFETGAKHVLDAASNPTQLEPINWKRYQFVLSKLPVEQQSEIAQRLLAHMEKTWGGQSAKTSAALETYANVLDFAGLISLATTNNKRAVALYDRYLQVMRELRRRDPQDPNRQVNETLAYLLLGDAHALSGDRQAAEQAYRDAERAFESSGKAAKDTLKFHDFAEELEARRKSLHSE
jgi:hypothetical protein